jgi:hypothetical protein
MAAISRSEMLGATAGLSSSAFDGGHFTAGQASSGTLLHAAAASETEPLIDQLDPELRARVLMALLGLVLVGLALIAVVVMGARYVRRLGRGRSTHAPVKDDAWFAKPLVPPNVAKNHRNDS